MWCSLQSEWLLWPCLQKKSLEILKLLSSDIHQCVKRQVSNHLESVCIDGLFAVVVKFATLMIYFKTCVTLPLASFRQNFIFQFEESQKHISHVSESTCNFLSSNSCYWVHRRQTSLLHLFFTCDLCSIVSHST